MLDSLTAAAHIKQNERAPWDAEVFSVEQNCTAHQTITLRPRILWNDPPHLRLGGEGQRGRWRRVRRGAGCVLQTVSFEVISMKSHRSDPTHSPAFALFSRSHLPRLPSQTATPHPPRRLPSLCTQKPPRSHRPSLPPAPCQYLSRQLSRLCADSFKTNIVGKERPVNVKWDGNQLSKRDQMVILSWWHLLAILRSSFHPSPLSSRWRPYNEINNLSLKFRALWAACSASQPPPVNSLTEWSLAHTHTHTHAHSDSFSCQKLEGLLCSRLKTTNTFFPFHSKSLTGDYISFPLR